MSFYTLDIRANKWSSFNLFIFYLRRFLFIGIILRFLFIGIILRFSFIYIIFRFLLMDIILRFLFIDIILIHLNCCRLLTDLFVNFLWFFFDFSLDTLHYCESFRLLNRKCHFYTNINIYIYYMYIYSLFLMEMLNKKYIPTCWFNLY